MNDQRIPLRFDSIIEFNQQKWRIISELGRGGTGIVYKVQNVETQEFAALKEFYPIIYCDRLYRNRNGYLETNSSINDEILKLYETQKRYELKMTNNARRSILNNNPYVYDVQDCTFMNTYNTNETIYLIKTESGNTLENILNTTTSLPSNIGEFLLQSVYALDTLHSKGIIHADIKFSNIFIEIDSSVKLLDFGTSFYKGKVTKEDLKNYTFMSYSEITCEPHRKSIIDSFFRRLNLLDSSPDFLDSILKKYNRLSEDVDYYAIFSLLYFLKLKKYPNMSEYGKYMYYINEKLEELKTRPLSKCLFQKMCIYFFNTYDANIDIKRIIIDYINAEYCEKSSLGELNNYLSSLRNKCSKNIYYTEWVRIEGCANPSLLTFNEFFNTVIESKNITITGVNASGKKSLIENISIKLIDEIYTYKLIPVIEWIPECLLPNQLPNEYSVIFINQKTITESKNNIIEPNTKNHYINIVGRTKYYDRYSDKYYPESGEFELLLLDKVYLKSLLKDRYIDNPFILFPPIANIIIQNESINTISDAILEYINLITTSSNKKYNCMIKRIMEDIIQLRIVQITNSLIFLDNIPQVISDAIFATGILAKEGNLIAFRDNIVAVYIKAQNIFNIIKHGTHIYQLNSLQIDYTQIDNITTFELVYHLLCKHSIDIKLLFTDHKYKTAKLILGMIMLFEPDIKHIEINDFIFKDDNDYNTLSGLSYIAYHLNKHIKFTDCTFGDIFLYPSENRYRYGSDDKIHYCGRDIPAVIKQNEEIEPVLSYRCVVCGYEKDKFNNDDFSKPLFSYKRAVVGTVKRSIPDGYRKRIGLCTLLEKNEVAILLCDGFTTLSIPKGNNISEITLIWSDQIKETTYAGIQISYKKGYVCVKIIDCSSTLCVLSYDVINDCAPEENMIFFSYNNKLYIVEKTSEYFYLTQYSVDSNFKLTDSIKLDKMNIDGIKNYNQFIIIYDSIGNLIGLYNIETKEYTIWKINYPCPLNINSFNIIPSFNGNNNSAVIEFYGYNQIVEVIDFNELTLHKWILGYNIAYRNIEFVNCEFTGQFAYETIYEIGRMAQTPKRGIAFSTNNPLYSIAASNKSINIALANAMNYETFSFNNSDDVSEAIVYFNNQKFSQFLLRNHLAKCGDEKIYKICRTDSSANLSLIYEWALNHCLNLNIIQIHKKIRWVEKVIFHNFHFENEGDLLYSLTHKLYKYLCKTNNLTKESIDFLLNLLKVSQDKGNLNAARTYNEYYKYKVPDHELFLVFYENNN